MRIILLKNNYNITPVPKSSIQKKALVSISTNKRGLKKKIKKIIGKHQQSNSAKIKSFQWPKDCAE